MRNTRNNHLYKHANFGSFRSFNIESYIAYRLAVLVMTFQNLLSPCHAYAPRARFITLDSNGLSGKVEFYPPPLSDFFIIYVHNTSRGWFLCVSFYSISVLCD